MNDRPPILTERGWDRRLIAMIGVAVALHVLAILALVWLPGFQLRPDARDQYDVEIVSLPKGRLPAGLPDLEDQGGGPEAPAAEREPAAEPPPPPEPEPRQEVEPPPPPPEPPPEKPREKADIIVPGAEATAAPSPTPSPSPRLTPKPTPTASATPRPTATRPRPSATPRPTASPTPRPRPTAAPTARPKPSPTIVRPKATASPRPAATRAKPVATASPRTAPGAAARPTQERAAPAPTRIAPAAGAESGRDARIAEALSRVKQRVGTGEAGAPAGPGAGAGAGQAGAGGSGPPLRPGERLGVPWGSDSAPARGAEFLAYYNEMIERVRAAWVWTGSGRADLEVMVRFGITDQGELVNVVLSKSSGDSSYDQSVLQALRAVRRLRPPPAAYRNDFADVELTFRPGDLQSSAGRPQ